MPIADLLQMLQQGGQPVGQPNAGRPLPNVQQGGPQVQGGGGDITRGLIEQLLGQPRPPAQHVPKPIGELNFLEKLALGGQGFTKQTYEAARQQAQFQNQQAATALPEGLADLLKRLEDQQIARDEDRHDERRADAKEARTRQNAVSDDAREFHQDAINDAQAVGVDPAQFGKESLGEIPTPVLRRATSQKNAEALSFTRAQATAAERHRTRTLRDAETVSVRALMAKHPSAFPRGTNSAKMSFDEAAGLLRESGVDLKATSLPATVKAQMGDMRDSVEAISDARDMFEELGAPGGPIAGNIPTVLQRANTKRFNSFLQKAVVTIRRALFGTAFTANERATGLALLPEINADATTMRNALEALESMMATKLATRIELFGDPFGTGMATTESLNPDELPPGFEPVEP